MICDADTSATGMRNADKGSADFELGRKRTALSAVVPEGMVPAMVRHDRCDVRQMKEPVESEGASPKRPNAFRSRG